MTDLIESTRQKCKPAGLKRLMTCGGRQKARGFFAGVAAESAALKHFLSASFYSHPAISEERDRSVAALDALFSFFMEHPGRMPANIRRTGAD